MGRACKVDEYKEIHSKLIWNTNYPDKTEDYTNFAKKFYDTHFEGKNSESHNFLIYNYVFNPTKTPDYMESASAQLILYRGYPFLTIYVTKDGMQEMQFHHEYEQEEYNLAKKDFDYWTSQFEKYVED